MKVFVEILKFIPSILVTGGIIAFWYDDFMAFIYAIVNFWITIPVVVTATVIFFISIRCKTTWQKVIVFYGLFNIALFAAYLVIGHPRQRCNPEIMERHYEKHAAELDNLHKYVVESLDSNTGVTLEWEHGRLDMFHVTASGIHDSHWNNDARHKQDSLMKTVGLTQEEFNSIRKQLKKAGCIGLEASTTTPQYITIWFRRVDMGCYDYLIKDTLFSEEEKASYLEDPAIIPYNQRIAFMYSGGAIGPQSFSQQEKAEYLDRHKPW